MPVFVALSLIVFLQLLSMASQFTTLNSFGMELGASAADVGWLWAAYALPRALSGPLLSGLSDRIGRRPLMLLGGVATVAARPPVRAGAHDKIVDLAVTQRRLRQQFPELVRREIGQIVA